VTAAVCPTHLNAGAVVPAGCPQAPSEGHRPGGRGARTVRGSGPGRGRAGCRARRGSGGPLGGPAGRSRSGPGRGPCRMPHHRFFPSSPSFRSAGAAFRTGGTAGSVVSAVAAGVVRRRARRVGPCPAPRVSGAGRADRSAVKTRLPRRRLRARRAVHNTSLTVRFPSRHFSARSRSNKITCRRSPGVLSVAGARMPPARSHGIASGDRAAGAGFRSAAGVPGRRGCMRPATTGFRAYLRGGGEEAASLPCTGCRRDC
jgi:hypothetical protein